MVPSKHFMAYFPDATSGGEEYKKILEDAFGKERVYPLNGSGAFVIKVDKNVNFQSVMDKVGMSEDARQVGVIIEFDNSNINGWYSQALWSFIKQDLN